MSSSTGLYRSRYNTMIGGVAGGISEAMNTDPVIIRLMFVLLTLFGGGGILVYIILWIALPLDPDLNYFKQSSNDNEMNMENNSTDRNAHGGKKNFPGKNKSDGSLMGGLILIGLGIIFLIERFIPWVSFGDLWPLILVFAGVALIVSNYSKTKQ